MSKTFRFQDLASEAGGGENIPEGQYDFVVEQTNTGETQAGDPKLGLFVRAEGGPQDGQTQWLNFTFGEKAAAISARQLQAAGIPLPSEGSVEALAAAAQGVRFSAKIKHNGQFVNISNVKPRDGQPAASVPSPAPTPPPPAPGGPGF